MVKAYQWEDVKYQPSWPDDLEWVRKKVRHRGAPQFIVIAGTDIVLHVGGNRDWAKKALPLIRKLVAGDPRRRDDRSRVRAYGAAATASIHRLDPAISPLTVRAG